MRVSLALVLGLAATSCGSDAPTATVSGVFPSQGFTGRTLRVEVSGDVTNFAAGATLDFGAGVTVANVTVASPTDLFADITIDGAAVLGPRDISVKNGSDTYTLAKSFELVSPVSVTTGGQFAQGSVATINIRNLDLTTAFDSTCGFSFFGQCFQYTGTTVTLGTGVNVQLSFVDDNHISGTAFIDTDAVGGTLAITSGTGATAIVSQAGDPVTVTTRTATAATTTAAPLTIANAGDSALVSFAATGPSVARALFDTADPQTASTVYILASTGHFADGLGQTSTPDAAGVIGANVLTKTAANYFAVYVDDGFQDPVTVKAATVTFATTLAEVEANDSSGTAQTVASLPALFDTATLASKLDQDWIKYTANGTDGGKHLHVITGPGDPRTDTVVNVLAANGTTSLGGPSDDSGYHEDFTSAAIANGVNFIKISASSAFSTSHTQYIAAIFLE